MPKLFAIISLGIVTGCAGVTEYTLTTPDGVVVEVRNSKDYESYELSATRQPDGSYSVQLIERGVISNNPLRAAKALNGRLMEKLLSAAL